MVNALPMLYLARHGDTAWTDSHQHTSRTDLPLNEHGVERARQLGEKLRRITLTQVFTSPLQRASKTCELCGFHSVAQVDHDLIEWNYGRFEGMRTADILKAQPEWELFRDGCPDGESPSEVSSRADRFIAKVQKSTGNVLAFSSGHIIRVIAARWLGLPPSYGKYFFCQPASLGLLGFEHDNINEPVIRLWNDIINQED